MGKLVILMLTSPMQFINTDTMYEFVKAALERGHEVVVYNTGDGVYNMMKTQVPEEEGAITPVKKLKELGEKGVRFVNCAPCTESRGINPAKDFIPGGELVSTFHVIESIKECDRFIAFTL